MKAALLLRERHDHPAVHLCEVGLAATADLEVAAVARAERRALVSGNLASTTRKAEGITWPRAALPSRT